MQRRDKTNYYLDIAEVVSERGTCIRRQFGAVIVKNDEIISTGYVGAARGLKNCCELEFCKREKLQIPSGQRYEMCRSVHAEQNAVISASRQELLGSRLYLVCKDYKTGELTPGTEPCQMCKRVLINAGVDEVYVRDTADTYRKFSVQDWIDSDDPYADIQGY
ncbi:MAG: dCMP deaminase family protein [Ruminococcus sp.]|jgi:dCMP deaminase|nr:dCMP deaminase family protein [Ruminococcus sp.]